MSRNDENMYSDSDFSEVESELVSLTSDSSGDIREAYRDSLNNTPVNDLDAWEIIVRGGPRSADELTRRLIRGTDYNGTLLHANSQNPVDGIPLLYQAVIEGRPFLVDLLFNEFGANPESQFMYDGEIWSVGRLLREDAYSLNSNVRRILTSRPVLYQQGRRRPLERTIPSANQTNIHEQRAKHGGVKRKRTRKKSQKKKTHKKRTRKDTRRFLYNPNDPKKSFDVYIDKNPSDTIPIKYTTIDDVKDTIKHLEKLYKKGKYPHKRIWQVGMIMKVRLGAMVKHQKTLYPKAKNLKRRFQIAEKYFQFLGKRSKIKSEKERKEMVFV
jgi:hypothetical protein